MIFCLPKRPRPSNCFPKAPGRSFRLTQRAEFNGRAIGERSILLMRRKIAILGALCRFSTRPSLRLTRGIRLGCGLYRLVWANFAV